MLPTKSVRPTEKTFVSLVVYIMGWQIMAIFGVQHYSQQNQGKHVLCANIQKSNGIFQVMYDFNQTSASQRRT